MKVVVLMGLLFLFLSLLVHTIERECIMSNTNQTYIKLLKYYKWGSICVMLTILLLTNFSFWG